ncbi:MAG: hypothetical protein Q4P66_00890 [Actinomycetaceae bacterium]|nr:hypothetical protein [Actinomycetaceae bacterium]
MTSPPIDTHHHKQTNALSLRQDEYIRRFDRSTPTANRINSSTFSISHAQYASNSLATRDHFRAGKYIPIKRRLIFPSNPTGYAQPTQNFWRPPEWFNDAWEDHKATSRRIFYQAKQFGVHSKSALPTLNILRYAHRNIHVTSDKEAKRIDRAIERNESNLHKVAYLHYIYVDPHLTAFETDRLISIARNVHAVNKQKSGVVLCFASACIMHDVPLFAPSETVHLWTGDNRRVRSSTISAACKSPCSGYKIERYSYNMPLTDIVRLGKVAVTSVERTLLDCLLRFRDPEWIITGDALLTKLCQERHPHFLCYRSNNGLTNRDKRCIEKVCAHLKKRLQALKSVPGKRRALKRLKLLTPMSGSAGESLTRLMLYEMGFRDIHCQVPVYWNRSKPASRSRVQIDRLFAPFPDAKANSAFQGTLGCTNNGNTFHEGEGKGDNSFCQVPTFYIDLFCGELNLAIEFDGRIKYDCTDATVILEEKNRELIVAQHFTSFHRLMWNTCKNWDDFIAIFSSRIRLRTMNHAA